MDKFAFTPADGFNDTASYPDPSSEAETRNQLMSLHTQTKEFINKLVDAVNTDESTLALKVTANDIKALRINSDNSIEFTLDGSNWQSSSSSGHIILNQYGDQFPQRTRMKFLNTEITDDGTTTIIAGIKGEKGDTGATGAQGAQGIQGIQGVAGATGAQGIQGIKGDKGEKGDSGADGNTFIILARFATYADLIATHPSGTAGQAYMVGSAESNIIYIWNTDTLYWQNVGSLQGPAGPQGPQGVAGPTGAQGVQGIQGPQGIQGIQGERGEKGEQGAQGQAGEGVPIGGNLGDILVKKTNTSYDTEWIEPYQCKLQNVTIPHASVVANTDSLSATFPYCYDYADSTITADTVIQDIVAQDVSNQTAYDAYCYGANLTSAGKVRIYFIAQPSTDMAVTLIIQKGVRQ